MFRSPLISGVIPSRSRRRADSNRCIVPLATAYRCARADGRLLVTRARPRIVTPALLLAGELALLGWLAWWPAVAA